IGGLEGIKPGRTVEVPRTLPAVRADAREEFPDGKFEKKNQDADFGLTTRWGITPNLTFGGTYNPDFSQVEADAAQLDINEPFSLYYQEKRPFFTEGADVFKTNLNTVYTRTLRAPVWGVKLSGKEGRNSIGAYVVRDDITNLILPGSQWSYSTSLDMPSTASVFRYKLDFGNKYTVGALFTNRQGGDYYNRVLGIDGVFRFTPRDLLEVEILGSSTRYPDETAADFLQKSGNFNDKAIFVSFRHSTRNLNVFGGYKNLGPDFRADLGFIPQVGYRQFHSAADYRWLAKPGKWWNMFLVGGMFYQAKEHQGNVLYEGLETVFIFNGALQSEFLLVTNIEREGYNGAIFNQTYSRGKLRLRPTADLDISVESKFGDRIDYSNSRPGKRFLLTSEIKYSLGNHLRLSVSHMYERMRAEKKKLYTANISQGTLIYQFSTRMFFRSILQYVNYSYNTENYLFPVNPEYKDLFVQLLFSYKLSPQTVLFLGYSDYHVGTDYFPLTRSDRTLFLKIGYAWQL
ncbi:MAG: hypothetical protein GY950_03625, partial [bacterium]|nr:hypothetical protein [bacterium]